MTSGGAGRVALVIGASGVLGSAVVEALSSRGWKVAAAGHRRLPEVATSQSLALIIDVTQVCSVEEGIQRVLQRWERIDVVVYCAGVTQDALLVRLSGDALDHVLGVNLRGAFLTCRAVIPEMIRRHSGHVILVGSHAARGSAGQSGYAASKAGLIGLGTSLAREVGGDGVRVNVVWPGVIKSPLTDQHSPDIWMQWRAASVLGQINQPAEVARWIVGLAESDQVSGQVFALDGRVGPWA